MLRCVREGISILYKMFYYCLFPPSFRSSRFPLVPFNTLNFFLLPCGSLMFFPFPSLISSVYFGSYHFPLVPISSHWFLSVTAFSFRFLLVLSISLWFLPPTFSSFCLIPVPSGSFHLLSDSPQGAAYHLSVQQADRIILSRRGETAIQLM